MLGRKDFTTDEIAAGRKVAANGFGDGVTALLALDRVFVHRLRAPSGKDTNPLTELELIVASVIDHDGVFTTNNVIKYRAEDSVLGYKPGDKVRITAAEVKRFAAAFFDELEARFTMSGA